MSLKQIYTYPKKKLFVWFCKNVDNAMFFEELIFVLIFLLSLAYNCYGGVEGPDEVKKN